jgi:hypothetical protein
MNALAILFWLAVLCIVVRLTLADSNTVLLACYESLRLFGKLFRIDVNMGSRAAKFVRAQESPAHMWVTWTHARLRLNLEFIT